MKSAGLTDEKKKTLLVQLHRLGIYEKDIEEQFIRSSGKGGQNVNKVCTCVHLIHRPTGVRVKFQKERTQGLNRYQARLLLAKKIEHLRQEQKKQIIARLEKLRRKNRKRARHTKEAVLKDKKCQSRKKQDRRKINIQKSDLMG